MSPQLRSELATWLTEAGLAVGRYALRGVERPQELFTLDPFWTA